MKFVDRKKEQQRLEKLLSGKTSAFVIVRGRRRIGKSALVGKVLKESDIYFEADRTAASNQRRNLSAVIAHIFPGFDDVTYPDWRTLLTSLEYRLNAGGNITLCLDEFPYLVENDASLPSVIQNLLDREGGIPYNLILCGSSQQMMYDLTHDESSPLYGRSDADFKMKPIALPYLQEALGLDAVETVENYAVWGGVPRYWLLREKSASLRDAIEEHILSTMGILYEEPARLFKDDIKDIVKISTIMSVVQGGAHRLKEISGRLEEPSTNLSRPLAKLVDLGYLEKETPFGESQKDSKRNLYQVADPFLSFHYKFVSPLRSFIEMGRDLPVRAALDKEFSTHVGHWWEHLCRDAVTGNMLSGTLWSEARRWWGKVQTDGKWEDVELDVVAESIDHKAILIGECKWSTGENARLLNAKLDKIAPLLPFAGGKEVKTALFLKTPPEEDEGNTILPEDIIRLLKAE